MIEYPKVLNKTSHKPPWLKRRLPSGPNYRKVSLLLGDRHLHTVCQEARCPNQWECFSQQTATFLILGDRCTRDCRFCAVAPGRPEKPDPAESARVAQTADQMGLRYVVITSVTRDDLPDGGAGCFAETIRAVRKRLPAARIEVLIPDFKGDPKALLTVIKARPDVLNHNIETVPRLYPQVRPVALYSRSRELLKNVAKFDPAIATKSGLMLGLGESPAEINQTLKDLLTAGCRILTLGQYLQPTPEHLPVYRYVTPEEFDRWGQIARDMGFDEVSSGPLVRSSYHAKELYDGIRPNNENEC